MTELVIEQTKDRNGHHAWKVIRGDDIAGRIDWYPNGGYAFSPRGYMPIFTAAELRELAEFIEAQS